MWIRWVLPDFSLPTIVLWMSEGLERSGGLACYKPGSCSQLLGWNKNFQVTGILFQLELWVVIMATPSSLFMVWWPLPKAVLCRWLRQCLCLLSFFMVSSFPPPLFFGENFHQPDTFLPLSFSYPDISIALPYSAFFCFWRKFYFSFHMISKKVKEGGREINEQKGIEKENV